MQNENKAIGTESTAFLRDSNLSASARGVLATMLSMPTDSTINVEKLSEMLPDGKTSISTALHLLEKNGYFKRERVQTTNGRFSWRYRFSGEPVFINDTDRRTE